MCSSFKMNVTHVTTSQVLRSISNFPFPLLFFFSRLSMLYYFNLSSYSKSCPLIHLSFSSFLLAVFPFHPFLKAKWCSNKHTHTQAHTSQSQVLQNQSFHQSSFSTTVDIILGSSLLSSAPWSTLYFLNQICLSHCCPIIFNSYNWLFYLLKYT